MKKIPLYVFLVLAFCNTSFAEIIKIDCQLSETPGLELPSEDLILLKQRTKPTFKINLDSKEVIAFNYGHSNKNNVKIGMVKISDSEKIVWDKEPYKANLVTYHRMTYHKNEKKLLEETIMTKNFETMKEIIEKGKTNDFFIRNEYIYKCKSVSANHSSSDTTLSILNYTTGMSTVVTKVTNKTFIEKMEDKVLKYFKEMKGVKEIQDEKPVIAEKEIPCEMKSEDKFWSGGKIYWCTHTISSYDKIVFWGNPKTKEVVKIFRYILIKTIDRQKVLENFKLEYGEPKDSLTVEKEIKFVWGDSYFDKTSIPGEVMIANGKIHGLGLSLSTDICDNPMTGLFGNACNELGVFDDPSHTVIILRLWDTDRYRKAMKLYSKGY